MIVAPCKHALIEAVYSSRTLPLVSGGTTPLNVYIPREEGDFLYSLVRHYRPAVTVEVGLANGLSALFLCAAHADNALGGRHIAIDPFQQTEWNNVGLGLLRQAGLDQAFRLVELPSHQALPDLEREGIRAGLVFIDGAHLTDYVFADALGADRLLTTGGLLAFDDSDWPAVQTVIRYFLANRHYQPAHPEIVIEPPPGQPSLAGRVLRQLPFLKHRLRSDVACPAKELGILGRCVVLRKLLDDDRNSQDPASHRQF